MTYPGAGPGLNPSVNPRRQRVTARPSMESWTRTSSRVWCTSSWRLSGGIFCVFLAQECSPTPGSSHPSQPAEFPASVNCSHMRTLSSDLPNGRNPDHTSLRRKTLFGNLDAILEASSTFLADIAQIDLSGRVRGRGVGDVCLKHVSVYALIVKSNNSLLIHASHSSKEVILFNRIVHIWKNKTNLSGLFRH